MIYLWLCILQIFTILFFFHLFFKIYINITIITHTVVFTIGLLFNSILIVDIWKGSINWGWRQSWHKLGTFRSWRAQATVESDTPVYKGQLTACWNSWLNCRCTFFNHFWIGFRLRFLFRVRFVIFFYWKFRFHF